MKKIFILTGEPSGDKLASTVISKLQKYYSKKNNLVILEAANPNYEPIKLDAQTVVIQGKLLAVWRKI